MGSWYWRPGPILTAHCRSRSVRGSSSPSPSLAPGSDLTHRLPVQATHAEDRIGHLEAPAAKRGERRRTHGPLGTIGDLERQAPALLTPDCEHGLGPTLDEKLGRVHQLRIEPSRPRDHEGMLPHSAPYTQGRTSEFVGKGVTCDDAGEACGEPPQRKGEGGDAAVVAGNEHLVLPQAADLGDETDYAALERVAGVAVGGGLVALVDADGEHPGVLARAVAVDRTRLFAATDQPVRFGFIQWQMGAALQVILGQAGLIQDRPDGGKVRLLGVVRGAGHGEFPIRKPEGVGGAREDERQGLERLGRGAGVDVGFGIANGLEYVAIRITDGETPAVDALEKCAARYGRDWSILGQAGVLGHLAIHPRSG